MPRPRTALRIVSKKQISGISYFYAIFWGPTIDKQVCRALGIVDDKTKKSRLTAEKLAFDLLNPTLTPKPILKVGVFRDLAENFWDWARSPYIKARVMRDPKAISREHAACMHGNMKKWAIPYLGEHRIDQITPGILDDWATHLLEHLSPQSVKHCINSVSGVLDQAHRHGVISFNPVKLMLPIPARNKVHGIFTPEEAQALLNPKNFDKIWGEPTSIHPSFSPMKHYVMNLLAAVTGARWNELIALTREDFQNMGSYWTVSINKSLGRLSGIKSGTKTGQGRTVPLAPVIMEKILPSVSLSGPLFSGRGKTGVLTHRTSQRAFVKALEAIGISESQQKERKLGIHSWRHWFTTTARAAELSDRVVMGFTEHRTERMNNHYTHLNAEALLSALPVQSKILVPEIG